MENEHLCLSWSGTRFEVVRREYFSCVLQPCFNLTSDKMWTNTACLKRLPFTDYVHVMIDRDARTLALCPCQQNAKDALRWCSNLSGKRNLDKYPAGFSPPCSSTGWDGTPHANTRSLEHIWLAEMGKLFYLI